MIPECSIFEYMYESNKDYPGDIAINYVGRKISYGELFKHIDRTASAFLKAGVKENEIVTIALPSIPEALYCVYALNKIGAVANMIHPLAGKEETVNYINEVKSRVVVIFDGAYSAIADSVSETTAERFIVASPGDSLQLPLKLAYALKVKKPKLDVKYFQTWNSFISEGKGQILTDYKKDCHGMAIISHTGGTTGTPKGCMLTDYNINAEIWQITMSMIGKRQEVMLTILPPFINYNLVNGMLEPLVFGFTVVLIPKYDSMKFAEYVSKYHVNHINSIPAYCEAILHIPNIEKYDLSSISNLFYGGEGMTEELETRVNEVLLKCGAQRKLQKGMGMTEATSATSVTFDSANMYESVGVPLSKNIYKIVDTDSGEEKRYCEEGEICITGPTVMQGYYNNVEETDALIQIHDDGQRWIHTGDLGHINEDGIVFITGRMKRILATKGQDGQPTKLFPDRIEKAIYTNPFVELCCVVGIPDIERMNYPKAFIVLKDSIESNRDAKQSIIETCKTKLPGYMVPDIIEFRDDLPRTSRGKVDYRILEQESINRS